MEMACWIVLRDGPRVSRSNRPRGRRHRFYHRKVRILVIESRTLTRKNISSENPLGSRNPCCCAPSVRYAGSNGKAKDGLAGDRRSGVLAAPSKRAGKRDYRCAGSGIPMLERISSTAVFFPAKRASVIWSVACLPWSSEIIRAKR